MKIGKKSRIREVACGRMKELRKRSGLTQDRFAVMIGISSDAIAKIERWEVTPSLETINKTCVALGITIGKFFEEAGKPIVSVSGHKYRENLFTYLNGKSPREIWKIQQASKLMLEE